MTFIKGQSGNPAGRPSGTPNRLNAEIKAAIEETFINLGGVEGLTEWARLRPDVFYATLLPKLLPKELAATLQTRAATVVLTSNVPFEEEERDETLLLSRHSG